MEHALLEQIGRRELVRTGHYIDGAWRTPHEGTFEVRDPATSQVVAEMSDGSAQEAASAVDSAVQAAAAWRRLTGRARASMLRSWHDLIVRNTQDLATIISAEQGKPLEEARGEVSYAASYVQWFAEEAARIHGEILPDSGAGSRRLMALREPVGVVGVITPWNFPLAMLARKAAPALAAGCTVVAKPSEETPLTAAALVQLAQEAGLPRGCVNLVAASRARAPEVVGTWLKDERVRKITFTGSTAVGKHLARESAGTLKRLSLELGGNAPFIVFEDADLDTAVASLMSAKFRNGGQACVAPNRIFVHESIAAAFIDRLAAAVSVLKVGPATCPHSRIGPLINSSARDKVERHVQDAISKGARLVAGGSQLLPPHVPSGGHYYPPTVLAEVTSSMIVMEEETFGPVIPVATFSGDDEAAARANATPYGLAAYFHTSDASRIWRFSERLEFGVLGINEGVLASEVAPFGGIKDSGYGREGSRHGLEDYQQLKYMCQGL